jgi:Sortase domain
MTVSPPRRLRRGWLPATLAAAAAACLAGGAHLLTEPARVAVADAGVLPGESVAQQPAAGPARRSAPPSIAVRRPRPTLPPPALPPVGLIAPTLHVRARVVPVGTDGAGGLDLPADPDRLGWWVGGAVPGAATGSVVLAGHIDTRRQGAGVMASVVRLPIGAPLQVDDGAGPPLRYTVSAVRSYPKTALPATVFRGSGAPRLVLVTCGGTFDARAHHYDDNIVVYAVPASG